MLTTRTLSALTSACAEPRGAQVIALCEKERDPPLQQIVVDTPGQIEIFTWSASGAIITEVGVSRPSDD